MEALNPLDWTAGPFLTLYVMLAGGVLLLVWRERLDAPKFTAGTGSLAGGLGILHLAYLAGGADLAAQTALVGLLEGGAAVSDRKRRTIRFDRSVPVEPEFQPFRHVSGDEADRSQFQAEFALRWQRLHDEMVERGLMPGPSEVTRWRWQGAALLCVPLLLGACKLVVGLWRDRPVEILAILLVLTVVAGSMILAPSPCRNLAGGAVLADARRIHARAARAPLPEETALAFALTGAAVLSNRDYRWALAPKGSSSSSDDSGGDSGGDGGGGCGGCSG